MISAAELSSFLDEIYDAAFDDEGWFAVFDRLAQVLGGNGASLAISDRTTFALEAVTVGVQVEHQRAYDHYVASICPTWPPTYGVPTGTVMIDRILVGRESYENGEFYNDFCRPMGMHSAIAVKVLHERRSSGVVMAVRGFDRPEFEPTDGHLLELLAPHLERALRVRERLKGVVRHKAAMVEALDQLSQAVMLVNSQSRIVFANRAANTILAAQDGLSSTPDGLRAATPDQTRDLRRLINALSSGFENPARSSEGLLAIHRPPPARPLSVLVAPITASRHGVPSLWPTAIVFVTDPDRAPPASQDHLSALYGLTPTEAAVALAVVDGEGVASVADRFKLSSATVRTHLHHIFAKTGTQRQAELVRLILESRIGRASP